jgi:Uracil DNA glycosylase superfamily
MSFAKKTISYFNGLKPPNIRFNDVELINPYESPAVRGVVREFYNKFYNDNNKRIFVFGINPGRFGGGLTGISFTDPVALREHCGIENAFGERKELSSKFIYKIIDDFGGPRKFFKKVFLTALYPFAIIKNGKNYNYYDEKSLAEKLKPDIVQTIKSQIDFGAKEDIVIILGKKNAEYFSKINDEFKFFKGVVVLEHPRYIMQYRLKKIDYYIKKYIGAIT